MLTSFFFCLLKHFVFHCISWLCEGTGISQYHVSSCTLGAFKQCNFCIESKMNIQKKGGLEYSTNIGWNTEYLSPAILSCFSEDTMSFTSITFSPKLIQIGHNLGYEIKFPIFQWAALHHACPGAKFQGYSLCRSWYKAEEFECKTQLFDRYLIWNFGIQCL